MKREDLAPWKKFVYLFLQKYSLSTHGVPGSVLDVGIANKSNGIAVLLDLGGKATNQQAK